MKKFIKATGYDYIVLASVILVAAVLMSIFDLARSRDNDGIAEIHVDGQLYKSVSLSREKHFKIPGMFIEVSRGRIRVAESSCRKKICVDSGWISSPGRSIVCVPNKTIISVSGVRKEYDAVTY